MTCHCEREALDPQGGCLWDALSPLSHVGINIKIIVTISDYVSATTFLVLFILFLPQQDYDLDKSNKFFKYNFDRDKALSGSR